jgi:hypothetical protein
MTTDYRAMCAELIDALDSGIPAGRIRMSPLADRARALLASSPDQDDATLKSIREHTPRYRMSVIISTNDSCIDTRMNVIWSALNSDTEILESVSLPEKLPTSEPRKGDIHYTWELEDVEGEWQAGGSADSLENVQREGNRYLHTYSQDGPHKLIIQRHCVTTIEEVTNAQ